MAVISSIGADQALKTTDDVIFSTIKTTNGFVFRTITGAEVLTSDDYGLQIICTSSPAYAVTLPAVSAGKFIDFFINTGSFALVTITPASGTIQGQATFILGAGESCRLYCDGTNWWIQNYMMMPLSFLVNIDPGGQTIADSTETKVQFNTIQYDTGGFFDNIVDYRYTPLYAGKYVIGFICAYDAMVSLSGCQSNIRLSGSQIAKNLIIQPSSSSSPSLVVEQPIELNGSTDYIDFSVFHDAGTNEDLSGNPIITYAYGYRISPF